MGEEHRENSAFYLDSISFQLKKAGISDSMVCNFVDVANDVARDVKKSDFAYVLKVLDKCLERRISQGCFSNAGIGWPFDEFEFRSWCYLALGIDRKIQYEPVNRRFSYGSCFQYFDGVAHSHRDHVAIGESIRRKKLLVDGKRSSVYMSEMAYHGKRGLEF